MASLPHRLSATAAIVALAGFLCLAPQARGQRGLQDFDTYGYTLVDSGCSSSFVDISLTGTPLSFTAAGAEAALDEGAAVLNLSQPFELYGLSHSSLIVSTNGYLAAAASLALEDGGDFSNDCSLPAIPGNDSSVAARLMPLHDDLAGDMTGGSVYHQYFATCPRSSETLGAEPCTVVQWHDWSVEGSAGTADFEVVLYHQSFLAVFLYADLSGIPITSVSVGLQNHSASVGLAANCNELGSLSSNSALCFVEPRFPLGGPVADLAVDLDDREATVRTGATVEYLFFVENRGPSPVPGASVAVPIPTGLENCSWSCTDSENASCAAGTIEGALADTPDLGPGGQVEYTIECTVSDPAPSLLELVGSAAPPAGTSDPEPSNDSSTDSDQVLQTLFEDDLELGSFEAWTKVLQ